MSIQEEIHKTITEIQAKLRKNQDLSSDELESLLLASLIEEAGSHE